jgi:hypothetical protein
MPLGTSSEHGSSPTLSYVLNRALLEAFARRVLDGRSGWPDIDRRGCLMQIRTYTCKASYISLVSDLI